MTGDEIRDALADRLRRDFPDIPVHSWSAAEIVEPTVQVIEDGEVVATFKPDIVHHSEPALTATVRLDQADDWRDTDFGERS